MSMVKSGASVIASTAVTTTSAAISVATDYAQEVYVSLVQVGTATTAAQVQIQVSPDGGTTYYSPPTLLVLAGLAAGTYNWVLSLPASTDHIIAVFTQQAGGTSSTCIVQLGQVTAI